MVPILGQDVFYHPAPEVVMPAKVTMIHEDSVNLTVFQPAGTPFHVAQVPHGKPAVSGFPDGFWSPSPIPRQRTDIAPDADEPDEPAPEGTAEPTGEPTAEGEASGEGEPVQTSEPPATPDEPEPEAE